jgi:RNA polymerase sigma-70 factor, ECF subfamily
VIVESEAPPVLTSVFTSAARDEVDPGVSAELADFRTVYREHARFLYAILRRLRVPDHEVGDALQEVFLVAYRRRASFTASAPLRSWLYGIALRVARSYNRKAAVRRFFFAAGREEGDAAAPTHDHDQVERKEALAIIDALLEQLPRKQREVFVLAELEGLTAQEIAPALGCNVNTVYSRLRLARERFEAGAARHRAREGFRRSST